MRALFEKLAENPRALSTHFSVFSWVPGAKFGPRQENAIAWQGDYFLDPAASVGGSTSVPRSVESVVNHRRFKGGRYVVAVSGGVLVDAKTWEARTNNVKEDRYGKLPLAHKDHARPATLPPEVWWWD